MSSRIDRKLLILMAIEDTIDNFLCYDRKDDEDLPRGEIEAAVAAGEITVDDIVHRFQNILMLRLPE